jgi:hypothetical protein
VRIGPNQVFEEVRSAIRVGIGICCRLRRWCVSEWRGLPIGEALKEWGFGGDPIGQELHGIGVHDGGAERRHLTGRRPSFEKTREETQPVWPSRRKRNRPVAESQMRMAGSSKPEADASSFPSGEMACAVIP